MGKDFRKEALDSLVDLAGNQGYVTFDDIVDCSDSYNLPIQDFDWLSNSLATRGIIIYDEVPDRKNEDDLDDYEDYAHTDYESIYREILNIDESLEELVNEVKSIIPSQYKEITNLKYQVVEGNAHAKQRLIDIHLRVALKLALQKYEIYGLEIGDAIGEAFVGLLIAVDRYNPYENGPFGSYASLWIIQNMSRAQVTKNPLIYYPVHRMELFTDFYDILNAEGCIDCRDLPQCNKIRSILIGKIGSEDKLIESMLMGFYRFESLEEIKEKYHDIVENEGFLFSNMVYDLDEDEEESSYNEVNVADAFENVVLSLLRDQIEEVLDALTDREQKVLMYRFGFYEGWARTLEEVGKIFNCTRERVRQIEAKALRKLSSPSRSRKLRDYLENLNNE